MRKTGLMAKFDTFIFDWDGTLISMKLARALNERLNPYWRHKQRNAGISSKKIGDIKNITIRKRAEYASEGLFTPLADLSLLLMKPKLHNDTKLVLQKLAKANKKIALFTNGAAYRVLPEVSHTGVEDYFEIILSGQDIKALKPNPLGINIAIKVTHSKPGRTIYIGDRAEDVATAKYAGVHSCAIADGLDSYGTLNAARPDYIFKSMEDFAKAL